MANSETEKSFENFKIPQALINVPNVEISVRLETSNVSSKDGVEANTEESETKQTKSKNCKRLIDVPLPYKEPSWSGVPEDLFSLEIIKNGIFLEMFKLKSLTVFGRLDVCDIKFEHPSVSRFHAVIQYCSGDKDHPKGFYLYDLGSTHGTFLNKEKVSPKIYYKLKVGYILKFGGSTRLHVFQGPDEEEQETAKKISPVEETCNWGMGDDADEEEDMTENPFALSTLNEELYLDDPKKTLRGWFEREGYELEYDVEEKGFKTFSCQIKLPIDTPSGDFMTVEASVSGKKREAVVACALEACRTLDRLGLLRQSQQESRERKKKNWEENDYYDSDEDTFLDRTGTIEKKRELRKKMHKKPEVETFVSLDTKLKSVITEINEITCKLSAGKNDVQNECNVEDDSLEAFMLTLNDSGEKMSDKLEIRKLKNRLAEAEKEKRHLEKLLEIVRPAKLPTAVKYPGMIGKRYKSKLSKISPKVKEVVPSSKFNENEEVEEDSDAEINSSEKVKETTNFTLDHSTFAQVSTAGNATSSHSFQESSDVKSPKVENSFTTTEVSSSIEEDNETLKTYGLIPAKPKIHLTKTKMSDMSLNIKISSNNNTNIKGSKETDKISVSKSSDAPAPKKQKNGSAKLIEQNIDVYKTGTSEYSTWVPPAGQTGDGMTHLNAKYGY